MIFYGNIQIPRISGNFDACADSVYQALFPRKKGSLGSRLYWGKHKNANCTTSCQRSFVKYWPLLCRGYIVLLNTIVSCIIVENCILVRLLVVAWLSVENK